MDGLKLLRVEITNFKNIDYREVDFAGRSAFVLGKNNVGKSSFLQAIASPMDAKYIPLDPVQQGEERAEIEVEIGGILNGEVTKYTMGAYFSTSNKKGRIELFDASGNKVPSAKKVIQGIIGNIGFDIFEFIRMGRTSTGQVSKAGVKQQIEILKNLMPHEGIVKLDTLTAEIAELNSKKHEIDAETRRFQKAIESHTFTQEEIEKYSDAIDIKDLQYEINTASEKIEEYDNKKSENRHLKSELESVEEEMEEIKKRFENLKKQKKDLTEKLDASNNWLTNSKRPDISELTNKLSTANEHNAKHIEVQSLLDMQKEIEANHEKAKEVLELSKAKTQEKKEVFSSYPLPVKGLAFDEDNITFKDLPLNSEQINTATLTKIGAKIAMAMNPNLRLIIIRDGSLLDKDSIETVLKMCDKYDYQVLIEKVADDEEFVVEFAEGDA